MQRTDRTAKPHHVVELGLTNRALNSLSRKGLSTISQLVALSAEELRFDVQGLGINGVHQIQAALEKHGLSLAPSTYKSRYGNGNPRDTTREDHERQSPK